MSYSEDFELFSITFLRVKLVIAAYCSYSVGIIFVAKFLDQSTKPATRMADIHQISATYEYLY